jgi:hypothetical protein
MLTEKQLELLEEKYLNDFPFVDPKLPADLFGEIKHLKYIVEIERNAANDLLSKISMWGYKTAGQSLPTELSEALFVFEVERTGRENRGV